MPHPTPPLRTAEPASERADRPLEQAGDRLRADPGHRRASSGHTAVAVDHRYRPPQEVQLHPRNIWRGMPTWSRWRAGSNSDFGRFSDLRAQLGRGGTRNPCLLRLDGSHRSRASADTASVAIWKPRRFRPGAATRRSPWGSGSALSTQIASRPHGDAPSSRGGRSAVPGQALRRPQSHRGDRAAYTVATGRTGLPARRHYPHSRDSPTPPMSIVLTDFARPRLFPREPRRNTIQDCTARGVRAVTSTHTRRLPCSTATPRSASCTSTATGPPPAAWRSRSTTPTATCCAAATKRARRTNCRCWCAGSRASTRRSRTYLIPILYSREQMAKEGNPIDADWGVVGCLYTMDARRNPARADHDDAQCAGREGGWVGCAAGSRGVSAECGVLGSECGVEAVRSGAGSIASPEVSTPFFASARMFLRHTIAQVRPLLLPERWRCDSPCRDRVGEIYAVAFRVLPGGILG